MDLHHHGIAERVDLPPTGRGALDGHRVGVKELIGLTGVVRTAGAPAAVSPQPQESDAVVVQRVRAAGGHVVAVTTSHALAYGIITPSTRNPRAPARVAGGSSGGSAAALALGLVDVALGTDTGGSVRIPAACCGVVGLKTTHGRIPLTGVQPLAPSLDTVGPMARSVAATATLFGVLDAGPTPALDLTAGDLRVGLPQQIWQARMDEEVRRLWLAVVDDLRCAGASIRSVDIGELVGAEHANGRILGAEALEEHAAVLDRAPAAVPADVRSRLEAARELAAREVLGARRHRERLRDDLATTFADCDVLCTPALPCLVPPLDTDPIDVGGQPEAVVQAMTRFTNPFNLAGVPAGSVPAGRERAPSARGRAGAPMAVQLVGAESRDERVLQAMAVVESLRGGPWPVVGRVQLPD